MNDRFSWAIDAMGLESDFTVAEIGCGEGKAAGLVAELVQSVRAIDRSATALAKAKKNIGKLKNVKLNLAELQIGSLGREPFDVIYCFNVNLFWNEPAGALGEYREVLQCLKESGRFFAFYQTPAKAFDPRICEALKKNLKTHGFQNIKVLKDKVTGSFGVSAKA